MKLPDQATLLLLALVSLATLAPLLLLDWNVEAQYTLAYLKAPACEVVKAHARERLVNEDLDGLCLVRIDGVRKSVVVTRGLVIESTELVARVADQGRAK